VSTPSDTTLRLVSLLLQRDTEGQKKYGTSLDRTDLTPEDWAQHAIEEALDMAGYLMRFNQTLAGLRDENAMLSEEIKSLRSLLEVSK
jgi:hypothetical protein